jgi:gluconate 2-dehydrogenase gamma chain
MLGTVGLTCAFPFSGDELYGQHIHVTLTEAPPTGPYAPTFFTPAEYATLSRLTDVIIPATSTPGASAAGVPEYIDRVVTLNVEHQRLVRAGLAWLKQQAKERFGSDAVSLDESQYVAILQPLSDEVDRQRRDARRRRFRNEANAGMVYYVAITDRTTPVGVTTDPAAPGLPVQFFRLVKNLTADGYYTSRAGLLEELGYAGNTALASFPVCDVREH